LLTPCAQAEEYVPLPRGDVHKKKEIVQVRMQTCWPAPFSDIFGL